jgi:uncharacterized FAD-dependent dehydrogenase
MPVRFPAEVTIDVSLDEASDVERWKPRVARSLGVPAEDLPPLVLKKRSLDARGGQVRFHLVVQVGEVGGEAEGPLGGAEPRDVGSPRVIVVGAGPCGLFCAYELARHGVGSVVLDRGKLVQPRRRDLKGLNRHGLVDPDSN